MGAMCIFFTLALGIIGLVVLVIVFVIGFALWSGLCVAGVFAARPKGRRWPWVLLTIPAYVPLFLLAGGLLAWAMWPDERDHFEYAFNTPPSQTVVIHDAALDGWCDSESIDLHFSATPADIRQLTSIGLTHDPRYAASTNGYADTRFGRITLAGKDVYTGTHLAGRYASEHALLIYDPSTGEAWYEYSGVD